LRTHRPRGSQGGGTLARCCFVFPRTGGGGGCPPKLVWQRGPGVFIAAGPGFAGLSSKFPRPGGFPFSPFRLASEGSVPGNCSFQRAIGRPSAFPAVQGTPAPARKLIPRAVSPPWGARPFSVNRGPWGRVFSSHLPEGLVHKRRPTNVPRDISKHKNGPFPWPIEGDAKRVEITFSRSDRSPFTFGRKGRGGLNRGGPFSHQSPSPYQLGPTVARLIPFKGAGGL